MAKFAVSGTRKFRRARRPKTLKLKTKPMEGEKRKIRVGITHGDTNGIGPEVVLKALSNPMILELCTPVVYSSSKLLNYHRKSIDSPTPQFNVVKSADNLKTNQPNLVEVLGGDEPNVEYGVASKHAGEAAFKSLEAAVSDLKRGVIDVLVTAPINKDNIQSAAFNFPGHTEYLEASIGNEGDKAMMILFNEQMRIALLSTHLPISKVSESVTRENVKEKIMLLNESLKRDFGIVRPRIAVLALNPHAGENGLLGKEEQEVISPVIEETYEQEKVLCFGPYAADGFFGNEQYRHFDGVLAMYHDQGLAPFKTLAMDDGVNFTAGLPYVRTSPDHGTGYDIAGKDMASEDSMRHAIYAAIDIYRNRERYDEMTANPLEKHYHPKGKDNVVLDLTKE